VEKVRWLRLKPSSLHFFARPPSLHLSLLFPPSLSPFLFPCFILYLLFYYLLKIKFILFDMGALPACMSVYHMNALVLGRAEDGVRFPETGIAYRL